MVKMNHILTLVTVVPLMINTVLCANMFESLFSPFECYGTEQPGCDTESEEWSNTNLTRADTRIYLFTCDNPDQPELLHKCGGKLPPNTKFNPESETWIICPGYVSGCCHFAIYRELVKEILKSGVCNVICIDWTWGNGADLYQAVRNLKIVAKQIASIVKYLNKDIYGKREEHGLTKPIISLFGHSLGCHMAALISQMERAEKISCMDPAAGPFSESTPLDERLDAGDADCVEVWHCNAGPCLPFHFGLDFPLGTIDFWINGGSYQNSCLRQTLIAFLKGDLIYGLFSLFLPACYHFQCLQYYRASINADKCSFIGSQCSSYTNFKKGLCRDCGSNGENCVVMGGKTCECLTEGQKFKSYYLNTDFNCPYCDNTGLKTTGYSCAAANITNGTTN